MPNTNPQLPKKAFFRAYSYNHRIIPSSEVVIKPHFISKEAFDFLMRRFIEKKRQTKLNCSKIVDTIILVKEGNPWNLGQK